MSLTPTMRSTGAPGGASAPANYIDWAAQNDVFSFMAAARGEQFSLTDGDRPERVRGTMTTSSLFPLFGVVADSRPHVASIRRTTRAQPRRRPQLRIVGAPLRFRSRHHRPGNFPQRRTPHCRGRDAAKFCAGWLWRALGSFRLRGADQFHPSERRSATNSEQQLSRCLWPVETGRHSREGARRDGCDQPPARESISDGQPRHRRSRHAVARRSRRRHSAGLASAFCGGRFSPLHRLRKCRQSLARPRRDAQPRNFDPRGDGREPLPVDPATAHRKRSAGGDRRSVGHRAGRVGDSVAHGNGAARFAELQGNRAQWPGARLQSWRLRHHRPDFRTRSGDFLFVRQPSGVIETRRARQHRRRQPAPRLSHRDRSRLVPHPADRRGSDDQELREPDEGRSRIQSQSPPHI